MKEIPVAKSELLAKLRANRDDHRAIFDEALVGFRKEVTAELERRLADLAAGERRNVYVNRPVPQDHTADYDRAITMVEMALSDEITLSERDFAQYVMDDWGWRDQFLSTSYNSATARGKFSEYYETHEIE